MRKYLISSLLFFSQATLACDPVQFIKKGAPSNCDGYVFSMAQELQVRKDAISLDSYKLLLDNKDKLLTLKDLQVVILTDQAKLWKDQSDTLAKQLVDKENSRFWYFIGGAALTTALAFAVSKAVR